LLVEARIPSTTQQELTRRGHPVGVLPAWSSVVGGAAVVAVQTESGVRQAGADPRRDSYAIPLE
jgi:gamma-glutamyltranspeptidase/glutathione hydrolase